MAAVAVVTCLLHVSLFRALQHDDAYISFRYARNLALGRGFVFNVGERTLGTTSPLFTMLMALPQALGLDVRWAALITSALALRAAGAALFVMLRQDHRVLGVAVFLFCCMGGFGFFDVSLLETFTVAALVLAAVAAFGEERMVTAGVLAGLAFLGRHDAFLIVPLLIAASWLRDREWPLSLLGAALATVLPWLLFATVYFGSPFPRTLAAKALLTPFGEYLTHYLELAYRLPGVALPWPVGLALSMAGLALFVRSRSLGAIIVVLYGVLHLCAYAAIGPPKLQHWHNFLPMLALRLAMLAGLFGWVALTRHARKLAPAVALSVAALCTFVGFHTRRAGETVATQPWLGERHRQYVAVAAYLEENVPRGGRMMSSEVGTLGYLTDRTMIDVWGLVSETNDYPRTQAFIDFIELVEHHRPDVLLMDDPEHGRLLAGATEYELVHVFPWQSPWSTLLVRRRR